MVDHPAARLDALFHALSDPTRRAMLGRLALAEQAVGELAAPFAMSLEAAAKHVRVLERAGLVARRIEGRRHRCRLVPAALAEAESWLAPYRQFWTARLDALEAALDKDADKESAP